MAANGECGLPKGLITRIKNTRKRPRVDNNKSGAKIDRNTLPLHLNAKKPNKYRTKHPILIGKGQSNQNDYFIILNNISILIIVT